MEKKEKNKLVLWASHELERGHSLNKIEDELRHKDKLNKQDTYRVLNEADKLKKIEDAKRSDVSEKQDKIITQNQRKSSFTFIIVILFVLLIIFYLYYVGIINLKSLSAITFK